MIPLINGESYVWAQIIINILGTPIAGVTAINFKEKQEKTNNYGAGNKPVSRGYGKKETEGSLTLYMEEVEALRASSPSRSLLDIPPFEIVVSWLPSNGAVVTKTLKAAEFLEDGVDTKEGDTSTPIELPLIIGDIKH